MGRPGLTKHRKFTRLSRLIGNPAIARGSLELIWDVAYENGDDLLGSSEDIEYMAGWQGESGKLTMALTESGFIDQNGDGYRVHDLWHHAPDYVRKRMTREEARREKGIVISELRSAAGRKSGEVRRGQKEQMANKREQTSNKCSTNGEQTEQNGHTPAPAPAPKDQKHPPTKPSRRTEYPDEFKEFWAAYPRPIYKKAAFLAWQSALKVDGATPGKITKSAKEYADQCDQERKEEKYIMHPEMFLHKERWQEYCYQDEV